MDLNTIALIGGIALGTYGMRALPMLWGRRLDTTGRPFRVLQTLGPMLIAALLAVSVVGDGAGRSGWLDWLPEVLGLLTALVLYRWRGGFVLPILAGVLAYALGLLLR
ncbi:MAG: AzlD domain-containing protein [Ectothiorhodospiraceae bacterium]|nr:AzlD domain-containing protein [Ectothiorhodospiraceae bacterium]